MRNPVKVSILHRRALNQAIIYSGRVPIRLNCGPIVFIRALRSALRMSQAQLARRSGVAQAHIARLEVGAIDPKLATMQRLFDAMFCDLLILPRPRKRPGDALAEQELEKQDGHRAWED